MRVFTFSVLAILLTLGQAAAGGTEEVGPLVVIIDDERGAECHAGLD